MDPLTAFDKADAEWTRLQEAADRAKEAVFEASAAAVREGHSPGYLADRMKARKTPEQIEAGLTFTAAYLRRKVRDLGVERLPGGPKPRK